jgi:hypothetical protein
MPFPLINGAATLDSVIYGVREKHGAILAAMHFRSIWIVGPSVSRTHQIDILPGGRFRAAKICLALSPRHPLNAV